MIALVQLSSLFIYPITTIINNIAKVKSAKVVLERLNDFGNFKNDSSLLGSKIATFNKSLKISNLSFSYNINQKVLNNVILTFSKNKKYAIVGESGCGKTTLVKLMLGYYLEFKGDISYDDINLRELDVSAVCQMTSLIHQNVFMFDTDIKQNN